MNSLFPAITVRLRLSHHHAPPQHPPSLTHRRPRTKTKPTRTRPHPLPLPSPDRRWTWPVSSLSGFCWIPWTAGWVQTAPLRAWPQHTGPWWSCFWWWRTWSRSGTWWRSMSWPWAMMMLSSEHSYRWEKWTVNHPSFPPPPKTVKFKPFYVWINYMRAGWKEVGACKKGPYLCMYLLAIR